VKIQGRIQTRAQIMGFALHTWALIMGFLFLYWVAASERKLRSWIFFQLQQQSSLETLISWQFFANLSS
jgi:hypothetical protein